MDLEFNKYYLIAILESRGCKVVFQSDDQTLLYDDNLTVYSVEMVDYKAVIRTSRYQKREFPTESIVNGENWDVGNPDVSHLDDLPLISICEERRAPIWYQSMQSRLECLPGASADPCEHYYLTGAIWGISSAEIAGIERSYQMDSENSEAARKSLLLGRIALFPKAVQEKYPSQGIPFTKKMGSLSNSVGKQ